MALKTMIENLNRARQEYERQLAAIGKDAATGVAEFLGAVIPPGFAVTWRAYTPGFNDGDPCVFNVHGGEIFPFPEGSTLGDIEVYGEDTENSISLGSYSAERYGNPDASYSIPVLPGLTREAFREVCEAWGQLKKDLIEAAFGDGHEVVVMSGGAYRRDDYDCGY